MLKSTSHVEEKEQSIEKQLKELLVLLEGMTLSVLYLFNFKIDKVSPNHFRQQRL